MRCLRHPHRHRHHDRLDGEPHGAGQGRPLGVRGAGRDPGQPAVPADSDNGSEFINGHLLSWCTDNKITFTQSRPNNSNDGCHVDQKNWAVARRTVGYWRYETAAEMGLLNQIWTALSPLTNLLTPQQKLISKTRVGAKVTKRYDTAKTPYQRLLDHPDALDDTGRRLL